MIRLLPVFGLFVSYTFTSPIWAKAEMVMIELQGGTLIAPMKITDPKIEEFNIWAGPFWESPAVNDGIPLENAKGFIIDWRPGVVPQHPTGLQHYEVSFYAGCRTNLNDPACAAEKPRLVYKVSYDCEPLSKRGFVYLPGYGEPWWDINSTHIYRGRGIEGHWFRATDAWDRFASAMIAKQ
jgi:hypothetical protein